MKFKFLFTAVLTLILFASCEKESTNQTYPIHGLWIGTYTVNSLPAQGSLFYSFVIYPDGTLITKGKGSDGKSYYSTGTWTLSGKNFSASYVTLIAPFGGAPVTQSMTATYSDSGTLTNGIWNDTNSPNGPPLSGTFSTMQRVN